jgi:outer membrane protein OmpA-like peptidoglycan-associated protein
MKKQMLLSFLFYLITHQIAFAQQIVDTYGYRCEVPQEWEVDREFSKNSNLFSFENDILFCVEFYPIEKINKIGVKAMNMIYENVGDFYLHSDSLMKSLTIRKQIENNGIEFTEFTHHSPPDEDGDYGFVKVWVTLNEQTQQYVFWSGSTDLNINTPETHKQEQIENVLKSITRFAKTVNYESRTLKQGESIDFTILFLADKATIEKESQKELKKIVKFLKDNPNIDVSIIGFANKIAQENRISLAKERAEEVMRKLISSKIDKNRLQAIGKEDTGINKKVEIIINQIK